MTELKLPSAMADLRPALGEIIELGLQRAPSFSTLLSSRQGLTIIVDNREERVTERPPAAGTVLSAFDGSTTFERAIGGFRQDEIQRETRDLVQEISFQKYSPAGRTGAPRRLCHAHADRPTRSLGPGKIGSLPRTPTAGQATRPAPGQCPCDVSGI